MKNFISLIVILIIITGSEISWSQGVGINTTTPKSMLDVEGNVAIGATYSGTTAAPINGMIVEGNVGIGTSSTADKVHVHGGGGGAGGIRITNYNRPHIEMKKANTGIEWSVVAGANDELHFKTAYAETDGTDADAVVSFTNEGSVGIGTTSPTAKLEISGDAESSAWATTYHATETSQFALRRARGTAAAPIAVQSGDGLGSISFRGYNGSAFTGSKAMVQALASENWTATNNGAELNFITTPTGSSTAATRMTIDDNGRVGIGTTIPGHDLHVTATGASTVTTINVSNSTLGTTSLLQTGPNQADGSSVGARVVLSDGGTGGKRWDITNGGVLAGVLAFRNNTDGINAMVIDATGEIGIGTTTPANRLVVYGSEANTQVGDGVNSALKLINSNTSAGGHLSELLFGVSTGNNFASIAGILRDATNNTSGDIAFSTRYITTEADLTERMIIKRNGNVGIGTTSPATSAILDVSSTTGAVLFPRMTTAQRDALTAVDGMVVYNTSTNKLQVRAASSWVDLH